MPLFIAPHNVELKILKILTDDKTKKHLLNLGINIGSKIRIINSTKTDVILKILDTTLGINKDTALKIIVA